MANPVSLINRPSCGSCIVGSSDVAILRNAGNKSSPQFIPQLATGPSAAANPFVGLTGSSLAPACFDYDGDTDMDCFFGRT